MPQFVAPSAKTDDTLRAVALALKLMPRTLRNDIYRETRALGNQLWRPIVDLNAHTKMDRLVLAKGARVKPGNPLVLVAATSRRPLKGGGGLVPNDSGRAWEFGTGNRGRFSEYERRSGSGGRHRVKRRTARQMPAKSSGRVVYAAAAEIAPRIAAMTVQVTVRKIYEAHEGK